MKTLLHAMSLLLVPLLILGALPHAVWAQTGDPIDPVVSNASSTSSNDETTEAVLVGLFVVVVALVFILGFKSDFGRSKYTQEKEIERTYAEFVKDGELADGAFAPPELKPAELDLASTP
jgi:hypothetical protein